MPNALTNTNISATYKGVLHANGEPLPDISIKPVYDGTGVQSALSLGRSNQGASVTGLLSANDVKAGELRMPNKDNGVQFQVVARTSPGILELKSLADLNGGGILDGTYTNPKITVSGGVITQIVSRPTITLFDTPVVIFNWETLDVNAIPNLVKTQDVPNVLSTVPINWFSVSSTIDGVVYSNLPDDVRYVVISTDLFAQSNSADYNLSYKIDNLEVSRGQVREDLDTKGVDTMINTNQQLFKIPLNKNSSTNFTLTFLNGNTGTKAGIGSLNKASLKVTAVGWIY